MARRLPRWVVWSGTTKEVYDMPGLKEARAYYLPDYGDRIGQVKWEPARKKRQKR